MSVLLAKLLLAPAFVVGASLVARRFGPLIGGLVGGLPVVAGPILLAFALQHGEAFAATAAVGTLLGLTSLTAFVVVYAFLAPRLRWWLCLPIGWLAFLGGTLALDGVSLTSGAALAVTFAAFALALVVLPDPDVPPAQTTPPWWDLPARALSALAMVLALTAAAGSLGSHLSGLLAPFPIIASILAAFTHSHAGAASAQRILRGMVMGYFAFALFCFTVAVTVEDLGIAGSFLLATGAALAAQGVALMTVNRTFRAGPLRNRRAG